MVKCVNFAHEETTNYSNVSVGVFADCTERNANKFSYRGFGHRFAKHSTATYCYDYWEPGFVYSCGCRIFQLF